MTKVVTKTDDLTAVGPYSLAVEKNGTLYCSGQIGIDSEKDLVEGGMQAEFKKIMSNVKDVLSEGGYEMVDIVKVILYVTDLDEYKNLNELYVEYFQEPFPARVTVEVSGLPLGACIEVEVTAVK